jgi:hypothetical protein
MKYSTKIKVLLKEPLVAEMALVYYCEQPWGTSPMWY